MELLPQPEGEALLRPMELPPSVAASLPAAPGSPVPSTPPRRVRQPALQRVESMEKLPSPRRFRRGSWGWEGSAGSPSPPPSSAIIPPLPSITAVSAVAASSTADATADNEEMVDIQQMRLRADSDAKYWAQIKYAHQLLMDSTCTELALEEVAASNRAVLEPLFSEAIAAQEMDRLSAVAMLRVLRQLVAEMDSELCRQRALASSTVRLEHEAPVREECEDTEVASKKAKCCEGPGEEDVAAAPQTPPNALVGPPAASTPVCSEPERTPQRRGHVSTLSERTPQRHGSASSYKDRTPPPVVRPSRALASAQPAEGSQKLREQA